jgi:hypothetical protein
VRGSEWRPGSGAQRGRSSAHQPEVAWAAPSVRRLFGFDFPRGPRVRRVVEFDGEPEYRYIRLCCILDAVKGVGCRRQLYAAARRVISEISVRLSPLVVPKVVIHTSTFDVLVRSCTAMRLCPG